MTDKGIKSPFQEAFGNPRIVGLVFLAAIISLVKIFNGNFLAATRLLFALGRSGLAHAKFGSVHARNLTPSAAVLALGAVTAAACFLGDAILIPVTEVGSMAAALGWLATCAAWFRIRGGDVAGHRAWMTRSFLLAMAAVTLRLYLPVAGLLGIPFESSYPVIAWMCWVPNLLVAEVLVRRTGARRSPALRAASTA